MTDQFWTVAWTIGTPFVMAMIALILGKMRVWVWGSQLDYEREQFVQRLAEQKKQADEALAAKDEEMRLFRAMALDALERGERVAGAAEQAVGLVERQTRRRRSP